MPYVPGSNTLIGSMGAGFSILGAGSTLLFAKSAVSHCHARLQGGAFYILQGGTVKVEESTVSSCTATHGGAFAIEYQGAVEFVRSRVEACLATEEGGAMFQSNDPLNVFASMHSTFVGCSCPDGNGGALTITGGRASIIGGETADCEARFGGAFHALGGELVVQNHRFTSCTSTIDGGTLRVDHKSKGAHAILTNCIMVNCRSSARGGVLSVLAGAATMQGCIIQGAYSGLGASMSVSGGKLHLLHTNISDSKAGIGGGVLYVDGGDADVQGCIISHVSGQNFGGTIVLTSGTLKIVESKIVDSKIATVGGLGAVMWVVGGSIEMQDVQVLNCSNPSAVGDIFVSEQVTFRAALLESDLDCTGSIFIFSEDSDRVLDVVGFSVLPSGCVTPPRAAQVSNANFIGCYDPSACGEAAECTERQLLPDLTSPECSCTGLNYPLPSAMSTQLAPYVRGVLGGCATPRRAKRVYVVGETVTTVVIELQKGTTKDALPVENITLATTMAGSGISSAMWTSALRYLPKYAPAWVKLQHDNGIIPAGAEQMSLWIMATSSGLAERNEAYQAHLNLFVVSQDNVTLSVPIFLTIRAMTTAAVWGKVQKNGRCQETVDAVPSMTHQLNDQIDIHFVACDVEMLPVEHRLPTVEDPREFSIRIRDANGEALQREVAFRVSIDMTSPGRYVVQLTLLHLAEYTLELVLANKPVATPLTIKAVCPKGRVPYGIECGCARGTIYNGETGVCEACPPNTYNSKTLRTDELLACMACPEDASSPKASTSKTMCQCNKGFYARTPDGLVYAEGDCVRCPLGTACDSIGHSTQTLPLLTGWFRASNTSVDVKRCADHDAEVGSGCVGGPAAWSCKDSLEGPLCVLCKDGPGHYYNSKDHACRECGDDTRYITIIGVLGMVIGLSLAFGLLLFYCSLPVAKACKPKRRVLRAVWGGLRSLMIKVSRSEHQTP